VDCFEALEKKREKKGRGERGGGNMPLYVQTEKVATLHYAILGLEGNSFCDKG
jgi:hypothetical protein